MTGPVRIGADIGGTFTDIVAFDDASGKYRILKVPSTPADYVQGIRNGLERLFAENDWAGADVDLFFHGTTVATNILIQKKGARTGLLTTTGFRDVLEVGRTERPPVDLYNLAIDRPEPLVPRRRRIGVPERIDYTGAVISQLDEQSVRRAINRMLDMGVNALAICLLNAYANDEHERTAFRIARNVRPDLYVATSSRVNPQYKEFERTSTTVLSAYVGPGIIHYLQNMKTMLSDLDVSSPLHIMQAGGGSMTADNVHDRAIGTILSGPAAGVLGARRVGQAVNEPDFVSFDMGGTSTDVSLVTNGEVRIVDETNVCGYHLRNPMIDIVTIGAGGGSIAWIDTGGGLKVGPQSAGAVPGPACYGAGTQATVTDAHVVLGYVDPAYFLGGRMPLDVERARTALQSNVAEPLGLSLVQAAAGIIRVANANMIRAIKRVSVERGHDIRRLSLIAFGGAGGLHAGQLLNELSMQRVILPPHPGLLSACGLIEADLEYQHVQSILRRLEDVDESTLREYFARLEARGREELGHDEINDKIQVKRAANCRYRKQARLVTVELGTHTADHALIRQRFLQEHERLYGYTTDEPVEIVDVRVGCARPGNNRVAWGKAARSPDDHGKPDRRAYFEEHGNYADCPVYARDALQATTRVHGPAIIEQEETNIVVRPGQILTVHPSGNLILSITKS